MKKIEHIYDITTGETKVVERDETSKEKAEREALEAKNAQLAAEAAAKAEQRAALLERLGLTEEEAKLLLS